jgi:hypothetical protein
MLPTGTVRLLPIIRRQRQSPNVLRSLQFDSAVSWLVWIDVHDLGCSAFVRETDMNRDFHPYAQRNGGHNQGTMEVDDKCLAFARQRFIDTMSLDPNFQTNPSALPRFMSN